MSREDFIIRKPIVAVTSSLDDDDIVATQTADLLLPCLHGSQKTTSTPYTKHSRRVIFSPTADTVVDTPTAVSIKRQREETQDIIPNSSHVHASSSTSDDDDELSWDVDTDAIEARVASAIDQASKLLSALQPAVQILKRRRLQPRATKEMYYEELRHVISDCEEEIDRRLTRYELKTLWSLASRIKVSDERGIDWPSLVKGTSVIPEDVSDMLCCSCNATVLDRTSICEQCAGAVVLLRCVIDTLDARRRQLVGDSDILSQIILWKHHDAVIYVSRESLK